MAYTYKSFSEFYNNGSKLDGDIVEYNGKKWIYNLASRTFELDGNYLYTTASSGGYAIISCKTNNGSGLLNLIRFDNTATGNYIAGTPKANLSVLESLSSSGLVINTNNSSPIKLSINDYETIRITNSSTFYGVTDGANINIYDQSSYAQNVGGSISFVGKYNTTGDLAGFGRILGIKENATNDNYAGCLYFQTRPNGGSQTTRMVISSAGSVLIGTTESIYDTNISADMSQYYSFQATGKTYNTRGLTLSNDNVGSDYGFWLINDSSKKIRFAAIRAEASSVTAGSEAGYLSFRTMSGGTMATERMKLDSVGNLGLCTGTPNSFLSVNSVPGVTMQVFAPSSYARMIVQSQTSDPEIHLIRYANSANDRAFRFYMPSAGGLILDQPADDYQTTMEILNITSGGSFGIKTGTSINATTQFPLVVSNTTSGGNTNIICKTTGAGGVAALYFNKDNTNYWQIGVDSNTNGDAFFIWNQLSSSHPFIIDRTTNNIHFHDTNDSNNYKSIHMKYSSENIFINSSVRDTCIYFGEENGSTYYNGAIETTYDNTVSGSRVSIGASYNNAKCYTTYQSNGDMLFYTAGTLRLRLQYSGASLFTGSLTVQGILYGDGGINANNIGVTNLTNSNWMTPVNYSWATDYTDINGFSISTTGNNPTTDGFINVSIVLNLSSPNNNGVGLDCAIIDGATGEYLAYYKVRYSNVSGWACTVPVKKNTTYLIHCTPNNDVAGTITSVVATVNFYRI